MKNILVMFLALGLLVTSAHVGFAQDAPPADNPPAAEPAPAPAPAAPDTAAPGEAPPAEAPAAAPAPAAPAEAPPADTTTSGSMPHTASPLPLVGLSGLAAFGAALALRLRRK